MGPFADLRPCRSSGPVSLVAFLTLAFWLAAGFLAVAANGQNTINTIAGGGNINPNPLMDALPGPTGLAEDAHGNLYVVAPVAQQVFKLSDGTASVIAGAGYYSSHPSSGSINGPALLEPMENPFGLAVDTQGNIYIADTNDTLVRVVNTQSQPITIAGVVIQPGEMATVAGDHNIQPCDGRWCGDGGAATYAALNGPQGVAVDASGNIYIADTNDNRVRCVLGAVGGCGDSKHKYTVGTIVPYAGNLTMCAAPTDTCGDGGPAKAANLNNPIGIALDSEGNLYITDTWDNRIRKVNTRGIIDTVAGSGNFCYGSGNCGDGGSATAANLARPRDVSVDGSGNLYIADTLDNRVRCVLGAAKGCGDPTDPVGTIITIAGSGQFGFGGDGGSATSAELAGPNGVLVETSGDVFIADTSNQRIREVSGGVINTIMGGGSGGNDGPPASATLANPYGVAVDSSNNYYIADSADNRIRVVNTSQVNQITVAGVVVNPGDIATVAGNGDVGWQGDTGPATLASLASPYDVAVDVSGDIFVADTGNGEVRCVLNVVGGCGDSRHLYSVGTIFTFAGTGRNCSGTNTCGDGGPATEAYVTPTTLAVDSSGNLYIADASDNRIRCVLGVVGGCGDSQQNYSVGTIITVAGTGQNGYSGDDGPATQAELSGSFGVALDAFDNLYIADAGNNVIRCVLGVAGGCSDTMGYPAGTIVTYAFNGNEKYSCHGNDVYRLNCARWGANAVAVDSRGNLFIGGGHQNLVQRVDLATGTIYTVAGNDLRLTWGYYGDGGPATKAELDNVGLAIDSNENLLIADAGNNRIRAVAPLIPVVSFNPTSLNFGSVPVGQQSQPRATTLQNIGSDDLVISSITVSGEFALTTQSTCPSDPTVAPTLSCTISVTFTPTKKGKQTGFITVTDNGYQSPQKVKLIGVGE